MNMKKAESCKKAAVRYYVVGQGQGRGNLFFWYSEYLAIGKQNYYSATHEETPFS